MYYIKEDVITSWLSWDEHWPRASSMFPISTSFLVTTNPLSHLLPNSLYKLFIFLPFPNHTTYSTVASDFPFYVISSGVGYSKKWALVGKKDSINSITFTCYEKLILPHERTFGVACWLIWHFFQTHNKKSSLHSWIFNQWKFWLFIFFLKFWTGLNNSCSFQFSLDIVYWYHSFFFYPIQIIFKRNNKK